MSPGWNAQRICKKSILDSSSLRFSTTPSIQITVNTQLYLLSQRLFCTISSRFESFVPQFLNQRRNVYLSQNRLAELMSCVIQGHYLGQNAKNKLHFNVHIFLSLMTKTTTPATKMAAPKMHARKRKLTAKTLIYTD